MHRNEELSEKSMVGGSYALNKRERAASEKPNHAVLGLDVLKAMLLDSIEQLSIAEIRN